MGDKCGHDKYLGAKCTRFLLTYSLQRKDIRGPKTFLKTMINYRINYENRLTHILLSWSQIILLLPFTWFSSCGNVTLLRVLLYNFIFLFFNCIVCIRLCPRGSLVMGFFLMCFKCYDASIQPSEFQNSLIPIII